jgi:hypothetical protein
MLNMISLPRQARDEDRKSRDTRGGVFCRSLWRRRCDTSVKKRHFCAISMQNAYFCQDRLGTNIGKTRNKSGVSLEDSSPIAFAINKHFHLMAGSGARLYIYKRTFYQDRLGTNIRKTPKKTRFPHIRYLVLSAFPTTFVPSLSC